MKRRNFLITSLTASLATRLHGQVKKPLRILLRSSWQTVNIGDIAHTPGMLTLLERHPPGAEITLWASKVDRGVEEILLARFPKLTIAKTEEERKAALAACDFFLHGSGPLLIGDDEMELARQAGKPYGNQDRIAVNAEFAEKDHANSARPSLRGCAKSGCVSL